MQTQTRSVPAAAGERSQFRLIGERRFGPFFATQFLGAFNDNVLKNAIVILVTFEVVRLGTLAPPVAVNVAAGLFVLPFFLFSASAGQLADKYDKATIIRWVKAAEIAIMALAAVGFVRGDAPILFASLFLMGLHSTVFGPVKYSILPQVLAERELVGGNALLESATFLAILLGTILGGVLVAVEGGSATLVPAVTIGLAVAGYLASRAVPSVAAPDPGLRFNWNPLTETVRNLRFAYGNRTVFLALLGISWFWFFGALLLSQVPAFVRGHLGGDESVATLFLAVFSIGIGAGSLLVERLSGHKVEIGLVPFGAIGLTVFALDLFLASPGAASGAPVGIGAFLAPPGALRILARSRAGEPLRRLLRGAALCARPDAGGEEPPVAHHRREQHPQRRLHGRRRAARGDLSPPRRDGAAAFPRDGAAQRRGRGLHLHVGARVPDALPRVAADPLGLPAPQDRASPHPRGGAGRHRREPRELRRRGGDHGRLAPPDPVHHGPRDLQDPGAVVHLPHRACDPHRRAQGGPGAPRARLHRSRRGPARGRARRHLPRGPDHGLRRARAVSPRREPHRRRDAGAGGADGAARALGLVLLAQGRGGDDQAVPARAFSRIELAVGAPMAPQSATPEALRAEIARLRGDMR